MKSIRLRVSSGVRRGGRPLWGAILLATPGIPTPPVGSLGASQHFGLVSSVPAKGGHVMKAPSEVRLTFSHPVSIPSVSLELLGPDRGRVETAAPQAGDSAQVALVRISGKLTAAGNYTVAWKAAGPNGDSVTGSFTFMYMAPGPPREP